MATQSSILAWDIPRTDEPGGLQSTGSQTVRQSRAHTHMSHETACFLCSEVPQEKSAVRNPQARAHRTRCWPRSQTPSLQNWEKYKPFIQKSPSQRCSVNRSQTDYSNSHMFNHSTVIETMTALTGELFSHKTKTLTFPSKTPLIQGQHAESLCASASVEPTHSSPASKPLLLPLHSRPSVKVQFYQSTHSSFWYLHDVWQEIQFVEKSTRIT